MNKQTKFELKYIFQSEAFQNVFCNKGYGGSYRMSFIRSLIFLIEND